MSSLTGAAGAYANRTRRSEVRGTNHGGSSVVPLFPASRPQTSPHGAQLVNTPLTGLGRNVEFAATPATTLAAATAGHQLLGGVLTPQPPSHLLSSCQPRGGTFTAQAMAFGGVPRYMPTNSFAAATPDRSQRPAAADGAADLAFGSSSAGGAGSAQGSGAVPSVSFGGVSGGAPRTLEAVLLIEHREELKAMLQEALTLLDNVYRCKHIFGDHLRFVDPSFAGEKVGRFDLKTPVVYDSSFAAMLCSPPVVLEGNDATQPGTNVQGGTYMKRNSNIAQSNSQFSGNVDDNNPGDLNITRNANGATSNAAANADYNNFNILGLNNPNAVSEEESHIMLREGLIKKLYKKNNRLEQENAFYREEIKRMDALSGIGRTPAHTLAIYDGHLPMDHPLFTPAMRRRCRSAPPTRTLLRTAVNGYGLSFPSQRAQVNGSERAGQDKLLDLVGDGRRASDGEEHYEEDQESGGSGPDEPSDGDESQPAAGAALEARLRGLRRRIVSLSAKFVTVQRERDQLLKERDDHRRLRDRLLNCYIVGRDRQIGALRGALQEALVKIANPMRLLRARQPHPQTNPAVATENIMKEVAARLSAEIVGVGDEILSAAAGAVLPVMPAPGSESDGTEMVTAPAVGCGGNAGGYQLSSTSGLLFPVETGDSSRNDNNGHLYFNQTAIDPSVVYRGSAAPNDGASNVRNGSPFFLTYGNIEAMLQQQQAIAVAAAGAGSMMVSSTTNTNSSAASGFPAVLPVAAGKGGMNTLATAPHYYHGLGAVHAVLNALVLGGENSVVVDYQQQTNAALGYYTGPGAAQALAAADGVTSDEHRPAAEASSQDNAPRSSGAATGTPAAEHTAGTAKAAKDTLNMAIPPGAQLLAPATLAAVGARRRDLLSRLRGIAEALPLPRRRALLLLMAELRQLFDALALQHRCLLAVFDEHRRAAAAEGVRLRLERLLMSERLRDMGVVA